MSKLKEDFIEHLQKYFKSKKLKYFVIKIEDLYPSMTEQDYFDFNRIVDQFNDYRKEQGKDYINNYFVLNMDEYPQFFDGDEFVKVMETLFKRSTKEEKIKTFLEWTGVSIYDLMDYTSKEPSKE